MTTRTRTIVLGVVLVAVVLALLFGGYHLFMYQKVAKNLPDKGMHVTFVEQGFPHMLVSNESSLAFLPPERRDDGILVFEEKPSPTDASEKIVLAQVPGMRGMVIGRVASDGTFTTLLSGESNKADLIVTEDGVAVVAATKILAPDPSAGPLPAASGEEGPEDDVVETGSADGPVDYGPMQDLSLERIPALLKVDLTTGAVSSLGLGKSPRLLPDGTLLALSPEGIVQIRVDDGARTLLFERKGADGGRSSISPGASVIALQSHEAAEGEGTAVDFYRYSGSPKNEITHLGLLSAGYLASSLAFVDETRFFVRTGENVVRLYHVPAEEMGSALPIAVMGISSNQ